jgi:hypothetical protein
MRHQGLSLAARGEKEMEITKDSLITLREGLDQEIAQCLLDHPELTQVEIAARFKVSRVWVIKVGQQYGIERPTGRRPAKAGR